VLRFASHDALLPRLALVVTHGGHGTAMRCLRAGVPMVVVAGVASDQPFVAKAVQEWGAGRALPGDAPAAEIRAAVQAVLDQPAYRAVAARLAGPLAARDGAVAAAESLETLVPASPKVGGATAG
jgi:UDP:flavonoid glycosyltransferase YjiC (YdhE family)